MHIILKSYSPFQPIQFYHFQEEGQLVSEIYTKFNLDKETTVLVSNGKNVDDSDLLKNYSNKIIEFRVRLNGGKGGFGSLLKGQPAVKKQTKNFDACRDISGRRLRHTNQEKQLAEWQIKKEEEEKIISQYNTNGKYDVKSMINEEKRNEIIKQNKKFLREEQNAKKSIGESFLALKRKRKEEKGKRAEKEEAKKKKKRKSQRKENINNEVEKMTKDELLFEILN